MNTSADPITFLFGTGGTDHFQPLSFLIMFVLRLTCPPHASPVTQRCTRRRGRQRRAITGSVVPCGCSHAAHRNMSYHEGRLTARENWRLIELTYRKKINEPYFSPYSEMYLLDEKMNTVTLLWKSDREENEANGRNRNIKRPIKNNINIQSTFYLDIVTG